VHPSVDNVVSALRSAGATGEPQVLTESTRTAAEAAAALGCDVAAIAKSLVFVADGLPVLVLASGAHQVDTGAVAALLEAGEVRRADAATARAATGQVIGGVAPVGHPTPLTTLVDSALARHDVVWASAGHPHAVFPTTYDELLRVTGGRASKVTA
jgi:prolyl-tRNA editing enzyme YbaK/EbsC (Cys-tRNA(Pro) deacylase)